MTDQPEHRAADGTPRARSARRACLIVESDPETRSSLEALIRELDVAVLGVAHALDAIAVLDRCRVDLVMTDERLAGPSGTMLLRAVRYRWPHVARVLMGDALGPDVLMRAVNECGVQRIVTKQMHAVTLRDEIEAALNGGWLASPDYQSARLSIPPFGASPPPHSVEPSQTLHAVRPSLRATGT